jgi:hypothetical protein
MEIITIKKIIKTKKEKVIKKIAKKNYCKKGNIALYYNTQ